ncbi:EF-P lysine aminoacylase EpmA [Endozoicomonas sp. YOMI1]|uniref:EF-P lysine aminoacylase EpmA n=1 Tax=Endozoicomonas sp. YOMI1 TaxID=2828739 RepID=UPI002147DD2D|nr:EF-P lysine aminoacylase EpmA [Endozoicomonas sp. YOMI1]
MSKDLWCPSASMMALRERAGLLHQVRAYFDARGVMEVETPMLSSSATVDVYIDSFATEFSPIGHGKSQLCYLHTSPEFAMKRLLAAGSGDIYSLGRVFRNGEAGGRHNPEFTMLEWYRIGMNDRRLMDDVADLLSSVCNFREVRRCSYGELFEKYLGANPYIATDEVLSQLVRDKVDAKLQGLERSDCQDLLFSKFVEPNLGSGDSEVLEGYFVYDYPATMSALARLSTNRDGHPVASRFELFVNGVELANGYHELLDAEEQKKRFEEEQQKRQERGYDIYPYDKHMVAALAHGMPDCAGVAMGIDRLLMLMLATGDIADVLAFDFSRA